MSAHQSEIRFELPRDELAVLDGFVQATGKSRGEVMRELLREWSDQKKHEAILICRTAGITIRLGRKRGGMRPRRVCTGNEAAPMSKQPKRKASRNGLQP